MRKFIDDITGTVFEYSCHNGTVYNVLILDGPLSVADCVTLVLDYHYS